MKVPCWSDQVFACEPSATALLVIDMQRDFLAADGDIARRYGNEALRAIIPNVKRVVAAARARGIEVIHAREGYLPDRSDVNRLKARYVGREGPNGPFLIRGAPGHDFLEGFEPEPGELVVDKPGFSMFYRTGFEEHLRRRGLTHLVLGGITTQCCVHSTLRDAVDRGYVCLTLEDCCAAEDPAVHAATMTIIQAENHLFGGIAGADAFLAALE